MRDDRSIHEVAVAVAASAGVLLLADLGLGWQSVVVTSGSVVLKVGATGWANVGLLAGFVTIALLVYMTRPLRQGRAADLTQGAVTGVLGIACFGFTVAAAFAGTSSVTASVGTHVVDHRQWPAYVGICLAAVVAAGALAAVGAVLHGGLDSRPSGGYRPE